jgi:hypothetical protein
VIVFVAIASVGLVGWLVVAVRRFAFALTPSSEPPEEPDVELAVRERLYGSRARVPRA